MADIQVLDVQSTVPSFVEQAVSRQDGHPGHRDASPRHEPESMPRTLEFLAQNEIGLGCADPEGRLPPPVRQCIGTDQTTSAP